MKIPEEIRKDIVKTVDVDDSSRETMDVCNVPSEAEVDEMTALKLVRDSYVDDNLSGGSEEEVAQMQGTLEKLPNGKLKYNGTVSWS